MLRWFRNIFDAVFTVLDAMWVSVRYWLRTYDPKRRTFTEQYEYPELPAAVFPRFRGFHRYDLTTCIACERCARDCPVGCIYIGKQSVRRAVRAFRSPATRSTTRKCMFCAICTESCPVDCIFMGSSYDLSCYSRDGCIVDFSRLPLEVAWGRATLNPTVVANAKVIADPFTRAPVREAGHPTTRRASPGDFQGISPVSNGTCLWFVSADILEPPGETESGSAGTQPDKGYPGSGAPMARQAPDGFCHQGPFS